MKFIFLSTLLLFFCAEATKSPTKAPKSLSACLGAGVPGQSGPGFCFPNDPCNVDLDCHQGRWPCRNGVCVSDLQQFAVGYFAFAVLGSALIGFFAVCPSIIIYGKVKQRQANKREREIDRQKRGNKNDQMRKSLVPAMSFEPFANPMYGGNSQMASAQQYPAREDEFYMDKMRNGGIVSSAGANWRQSVMMSEMPQLRQEALARQRQEQQFGGLQAGIRGSVMAFSNAVGMGGGGPISMYNARQMNEISGGSGMPDIDKIYRHADLCAKAVERDGAQTMNINVRALQAERNEAIRLYLILAMFLKLLSLDGAALDRVKDRIAQPVSQVASLMNEGLKSNGNPQRQKECLDQVLMLSRQLIAALTSFEGPFAPFQGAENWAFDSPEFLALDEYVSDCAYLFDDIDENDLLATEGSCARCCRKTANTLQIPDSMRLHPVFYFFYIMVQFFLIFSFFFGKCDLFPNGQFTNVQALVNNQTVIINAPAGVLGGVPPHVCLLAKGRTFFGVPEQYTGSLGKGTITDTIIPFLYGVMHQLMFLFGTLPIPMCRGLWRDVAYYIPISKKIFPIDTAYWFHMYVGYCALLSLFTGASIWILQVAINECLLGPNKASCTAFDQRIVNPADFFNPGINVVMLRVVVVLTWGFIVPLMRWRAAPPVFLPQFIKGYWFEFVYFGHVLTAWASFVLAMICRFPIFYPTLANWLIYFLDTFRETLLMTYRTQIDKSRTYIHTDPQDNNKPTTMTIRFFNPERSDLRGGACRKYMVQGAGTWCYVKVPAVSNIEWHPFSVASCTGDDFLSLQIGIKAGQGRIGSSKDSWVLKDNSYNGDKQWVQEGGESWTYKLYQVLRNSKEDIDVIIRGPYGSTFSSIFDRSTKGAVIIGAGTGLSAVESCLRMMIYKRSIGEYTPPHVWVMWQTRRVGDLLWLWDSLNQLLIEALNNGSIQKSKIWSPQKSQYLGWLGITFFISRADQNQLDTLRSMPRAPNDNHNVHTWLTNRSRILQSSLSNEQTSITKYIRHVRAHLNRTEGRNSKLAIGFCGPIPVAKIISDACSEYGTVEFSYATE